MPKGPLSPERRAELLDRLARGRALRAANLAVKQANKEKEMPQIGGNPNEAAVPEADRQAAISGNVAQIADRPFRNQVESWNRADETDKFTLAPITVHVGSERMTMRLRHAHGPFVFATIADNPDLAELPDHDWRRAARDALGRFCALHNLSIQRGPSPEDTNPLNMLVQLSGNVPKGAK